MTEPSSAGCLRCTNNQRLREAVLNGMQCPHCKRTVPVPDSVILGYTYPWTMPEKELQPRIP